MYFQRGGKNQCKGRGTHSIEMMTQLLYHNLLHQVVTEVISAATEGKEGQ